MAELNPDLAFEAFGRAMARIGGLEQVMRLALGEHEIRRAKAAGDTNRERLQNFSRRLLKLDFGGLAQRVCDKFKLPDPWREILKDAKGFRNYFAHDFWSPNYGNLRSARGISIIVRHCGTLERHLDLLSTHLIRATGVDVESYLRFVEEHAHDEEIFQGWESRLTVSEEALATDEANSLAATAAASPPDQAKR